MKTITIRKIYQGNVELRRYNVLKYIKKNETVRIVYNNQQMILTPEDLKKGTIINTQYGPITGQRYILVGFPWIPMKPPTYIFEGDTARIVR